MGWYFLIGILVISIIVWLYQKHDPGDWEDFAVPDPDAKIVDVSSSLHKQNSIKRHYETVITFSDGYSFKTKKIKIEHNEPCIKMSLTNYTQYSIDDYLMLEILKDAIAAHKKAVEKKMRNRKNHAGKPDDKQNDTLSEKTDLQETYKGRSGSNV